MARFRATANFLKHANLDPEGILSPIDPSDVDGRIGFCLLLYRSLKGTFTPTMAAFHNWVIVRHPDQFMIADDSDSEFEQDYRQAIASQDRGGEMIFLNCLLEVYRKGLIPPGIARRWAADQFKFRPRGARGNLTLRSILRNLRILLKIERVDPSPNFFRGNDVL